jgi:hypothetical protein
MGVDLHDNVTDAVVFSVNFWHYRAIVEANRTLAVLPDNRIDSLHEPGCGNGLSMGEARLVAAALRQVVLPRLTERDRLLLDGAIMDRPDDYVLHRNADLHLNYSTTVEVLRKFVLCCETCEGFSVW